MIKDKETLKDFENELRRREKADFGRNLKVFEALYPKGFAFFLLMFF